MVHRCATFEGPRASDAMPVPTTSLCLDLGNTLAKYAVFRGGTLLEAAALDKEQLVASLELLLKRTHPDRSILCSVVHHPESIVQVLESRCDTLQLDASTPLPFRNDYERPETLGPDRLALAAGARALFPDRHNLVIALGTCITYNFISKQGRFLGGAISPGMRMRFQALHAYTDLLPLVEPTAEVPRIGYNTRQSILSGVMLGIQGELEATIHAYRASYGNFNALLTGGDLEFFVSPLKNEIFADSLLIFKGLHAILEFNASSSV